MGGGELQLDVGNALGDCRSNLREWFAEFGRNRLERCGDLLGKLRLRERRAGADEEARDQQGPADDTRAARASDVRLNARREVAGHSSGSCVRPLFTKTFCQLRAPLCFALFAFGEMLLQRLQVDEPDAARDAARLHQAFTAPAREVVGRHADERRRLSGGHEARAIDCDFVDHADGRKD